MTQERVHRNFAMLMCKPRSDEWLSISGIGISACQLFANKAR